MLFIRLITLLALVAGVSSVRVIGWWVGSINDPTFPIEQFPWKMYTHFRHGQPITFENGTAYCNKTDYAFQRILKKAHHHDVKVQWAPGIQDMHDFLWNPQKSYLRDNYMKSIGNAVHECGVDGIEIDYEFQDSKYMNWGFVTPKESTHYSKFLADLKKTLGPHKVVSADVSIWGMAEGNYILGIFPWVNATILNSGGFDFINTMSYHWNREGNIWAWEKDGWFIDQWGIDRKRVNIGIPYFSKNWLGGKLVGEPLWKTLSALCPNIAPDQNVCRDIPFIGKEMNKKLGRWVKEKGFGGVFPWAANYDTLQFNNSLIPWLMEGLSHN